MGRLGVGGGVVAAQASRRLRVRSLVSAQLQHWWLCRNPSKEKRKQRKHRTGVYTAGPPRVSHRRLAVTVQAADERVRLVGLAAGVHVGERVVDQAVAGFVGADDAEHVAVRGVGGQAPVRARNLGHLGALERRQLLLVDQLHDVRVRAHGLLLKVPDEAVHEARVGEVQNEEHGEHHALRHDDRPAEHNAGLADVHERQQVHALVLRLLQQCVNPTVISFQST
mmetsp:Transcript_9913/g.11257  ORF Transcript_9913/g.11257 Transcript_9913/m.11257 type:complete len:224 (-) Transcript_9913:491-1162(-)